MVKVEQLNLLNKIVFLIFIALFLSSCAKNAPDLPKDYSSINSNEKIKETDFKKELLDFSCDDIIVQLQELDSFNEKNIDKIKSTRTQNQAIGYVSTLLFPPLWFAIENHSETKDKIDEVYKQKDMLYKLQKYKNCN